jgi:hypothetical protein
MSESDKQAGCCQELHQHAVKPFCSVIAVSAGTVKRRQRDFHFFEEEMLEGTTG